MYCRGISEPPQQSILFHCCHIKARGRKECLRGQSINSMQLQVQSHCTQSGTIPLLSGGTDKSSPPETKGWDLLVQSVEELYLFKIYILKEFLFLFAPVLSLTCKDQDFNTVSDFIAASLMVEW